MFSNENTETQDVKVKPLKVGKKQPAQEKRGGREREREYSTVNANQVWLYWTSHERGKH